MTIHLFNLTGKRSAVDILAGWKCLGTANDEQF